MNFRSYEIKDICKIKSGKRLPKGTDFSEKPTKHKYIRARDIKNGKIDGSDLGYISEETQKKIERYIVNTNDIIITIAGTIGEVALVSKKFDGVNLTENAVRLTEFSKDVCPEFLAYILKSPERKEYMEQVAGGSAQPKLGIYKIEAIKVDLPDVQIQHKIADILSAYDNLIENNQKQIKLLEEAAQRLYKEWFVDLRFPGHENTKIVDGVPEGWQYEKLGDLVKTTSGGTPSRRKSEYYVNGNIRWIKTKELNDRFIFETEEHITEDAVKNSSAKVLPEGALIVAMYGATIGKIGITAAEMACNQACCAFISFDDMISKEYLYCWLMDNREYLVSQGKGAAQSNLSQEMIRNFSLLCPDKKVIKKFTEIVTTILENKRVLENKILMLSKARDDLLPKLMSGEVEV
ncbi:restriction endonuclease subunit S [Faecalibacterium prausnitzii]|jgi:type I restriction enzyme S subunit|uniref:restriction endonuclease subunit S n=1 Tax=Faecalibacterium prausnitzii TaxID=853 RepID=UPI00356630CD